MRLRKENMRDLQEDLGILHFVRKYDHCEECQGWDERYEGVQAPRRNLYGAALDDATFPTGVKLQGRTNHRRTCAGKAAE
jgi:hypothetical protein